MADPAGDDRADSDRPSPLRWIGRNTTRVLKVVVGTAVMAVGVAMLALPGPGLVVIVIGLLILATEFDWAERALDRTKEVASESLARVREDPSSRRAAIVSSLGLVGGGIAVAVFVEGFLPAGVSAVVAGLVGLGLLSPRVQRWIDDQDSD